MNTDAGTGLDAWTAHYIAGAECPYCPSLPSSEFAYKAIQGDAGAMVGVVGTSLFRAALIASGIYIMGKPDPHLLRNSLAGAAMVELFVLGWIASRAP